MESMEQQILRIVDAFTGNRDNSAEALISYAQKHGDPKTRILTVDTWKDGWANIGNAAQAVDRLATVFHKAGLNVQVKDQPTHAAKDERGSSVCWDNKPVLTVELPSKKSSLREIDEAFGFIKFGGKAEKFTAHPS